jgi:hypothetical protein
MPRPRKTAGRSPQAGVPCVTTSRAEVEFQRVTGIARARLDRGELSAGAYAVILDRAGKSRDAADDDPDGIM